MNALPIKREGEMGSWRRHSREFKKQAVEKMKTSDNIHELAGELGVERKLLYSWRYQFEGRPEKNHANYCGDVAPDTVEARLRRENQELKEALGGKAAEAGFFAAALRRVNKDGQAIGANGDPASRPKSRRRSQRKAN
jgi:transposase-like protein